jgi:hypothetical protein
MNSVAHSLTLLVGVLLRLPIEGAAVNLRSREGSRSSTESILSSEVARADHRAGYGEIAETSA